MAKRLLALLVLLAAAESFAQDISSTTFVNVQSNSTTQTLTMAKPTSPSDGVDVSRVTALRFSVCAVSGQTLSGGSVEVWLYIPAQGDWSHGKTLDQTITVSGDRCQHWDLPATLVHAGRMKLRNNGVLVSGGTTTNNVIEFVKQ